MKWWYSLLAVVAVSSVPAFGQQGFRFVDSQPDPFAAPFYHPTPDRPDSLNSLYPTSLTTEQGQQPGSEGGAAQPGTGEGRGGGGGDLAKKFTDPTALLTSYQFVSQYNPSVVGTNGGGFQFLFRPVIPIPKNDIVPLPQILRIVAPISSALYPNFGGALPPGVTIGLPGGFGDVQLFDLFVMPLSKTFTFGVGPVAIFPTATSRFTGQGRCQLGPAVVGMYTGIEKWQLGMLAQELFSLGSSNRESIHQMIYQLIVVRHFEKGWYMGFCGQPATINWRDNRAQFPVGVSLGRVFAIGKQPVNFNIAPTYYAGSTDLQTRFQIQFNFALIYGK